MAQVELCYQKRPNVLGALIKFVVVPRTGFKPHIGMPDIQARWPNAQVNARVLAKYLSALNIEPSEHLPVLYPHVLANGMHMHMLAHKAFPFRAMGVLHLKNRIRQLHPIALNATMDIHAYTGAVRYVEKGLEFDFVTDVYVAGEKCWEEVSTYFAAGKFSTDSSAQQNPSFELTSLAAAESLRPWYVPKNQGRVYAKLSGDHNPIHTSKLAAKLFGLKRDIAHGTGLLAQAVEQSGFMRQQPDQAWQIDVVFKGPVYLGTKVELKTQMVDGNNAAHGRFDLYSEGNPKPNFCLHISPITTCAA